MYIIRIHNYTSCKIVKCNKVFYRQCTTIQTIHVNLYGDPFGVCYYKYDCDNIRCFSMETFDHQQFDAPSEFVITNTIVIILGVSPWKHLIINNLKLMN